MTLQIHELHGDQCRYVLNDKAPFVCCGEPVTRGAYCETHAARCYNGHGKDWRTIADMIDAVEQTVVHV